MAIADVITSMNEHTKAAYNALEEKGATLPTDKNLENLAETIANLPAGGGSYGVLTYTDENGETQEADVDALLLIALCDQSGGNSLLVEGTMVPKNSVTKFVGTAALTSTPSNFLASSWNGGYDNLAEVTLDAATTVLGENFLSQSTALTALTMPGATKIGGRFLSQCTNFDSPLDLSGVVEIGDYFLSGCQNFNSPVTLSANLTKIGSNFMESCQSYTYPLTIPASVIQIGDGFLSFGRDFTGPLTIETQTLPENSQSSYSWTLATSDETAPMYATGITVEGAGATVWKENIWNRDINNIYRNIIGASGIPAACILTLPDGTTETLSAWMDVNQYFSPYSSWPTYAIKSIAFQPAFASLEMLSGAWSQFVYNLTKSPVAESLESVTGNEYWPDQGDGMVRTPPYSDSLAPVLTTYTGIPSWAFKFSDSGFIKNAPYFTSPVVVPERFTEIPTEFLRNCPTFVGPVTIENENITVQTTSPNYYNAFVNSYETDTATPPLAFTQGVTIEGAGAAKVVAALPILNNEYDTGHWMYRNLKLASNS